MENSAPCIGYQKPKEVLCLFPHFRQKEKINCFTPERIVEHVNSRAIESCQAISNNMWMLSVI